MRFTYHVQRQQKQDSYMFFALRKSQPCYSTHPPVDMLLGNILSGEKSAQ
jgi:hypothetical protein